MLIVKLISVYTDCYYIHQREGKYRSKLNRGLLYVWGDFFRHENKQLFKDSFTILSHIQRVTVTLILFITSGRPEYLGTEEKLRWFMGREETQVWEPSKRPSIVQG